MIPYFAGVGLLILGIFAGLYAQWKTTQDLYFQQEAVASDTAKVIEEIRESDVEHSVASETATTTIAPVEAEPTTVETVPEETAVSKEEVVPEETVPEVGQEDITEGELAHQAVEPAFDLSVSPETTADDQGQQLIDQAVTTLYGYQSSFLGELEALYAQASVDFYALPEAEQTQENRDAIAMGYAIMGSKLETSCDQLVSELLAQLTIDLEKIGASTDQVALMRATYIAEKEAKKAYYNDMLS